jgi:hypothetical protein
MRKGVPLRLKPTDWESVFRSTKEEFCRPRSVRPLLQHRTKIHNRTSCRLRLMACRARGSGRQRATPTPSERGFSSRAITRTGITYSLHVMAASQTSGCSLSRVPSNRSTLADFPVLISSMSGLVDWRFTTHRGGRSKPNGKDHLPNGPAIHREQVPTAIRIPRPLMPRPPP